jgi:hypothetical protein
MNTIHFLRDQATIHVEAHMIPEETTEQKDWISNVPLPHKTFSFCEQSVSLA